MQYPQSTLTHGYTNRLLSIDIGTATISVIDLDPEIRDFFIGGRGLGLYFLHKRISAATKPTDPENPLIFSPGPLGGIPQFPGTSKCMAISLSPLTKIPGVSNFGGHFGAFLKYAGFDLLEITGKTSKPVSIVINSFTREIDIIPAPPINEVFELETHLVKLYTDKGYDKKEIVFVSSGIGADNTHFGCINSHYYDPTKPVNGAKGVFRTKQAGRTGLGSIMHDKKLSSVVILSTYPKGNNPYGAHDWEKVKKAGTTLFKVVKEVDPNSLQMQRKGSAGLISFMNKEDYKSLPVHNYQYGSHPDAEKICGTHYAESLFEHKGMDGCFPGCNLQCTKGGCVTLKTGKHKGKRVWVDGPEYETAAGFGSNIGVWDPHLIMEANWYCDNYGVDTITLAVIIAFLMECFQRGYLTPEDTGGYSITWGDGIGVLNFIHSVVYRESELARIVGQGMPELIKWIIDKYQARTNRSDARGEIEKFAMHTKGLPFSLYRTHRSLSMQGSYAAASDIGAHHAAAWLIKLDLLGAFPTFKDKAMSLVSYPRVRLGNDNLGLCKLPWVDVFNPDSKLREGTDIFINPASQEIYADFYNGMLGTNMTWQEIFAQTDRDINLQRVMNIMVYGKNTGDHDWIPDRAIGPIDGELYDNEKEYHDGEVSKILEKSPDEVAALSSGEKQKILIDHRKKSLRELIQAYYEERGWTDSGIPTVTTLKELGLWKFITPEAQEILSSFNGH
ncbi:MAG: hypothetical protein JXJ04_20610 [Spirochaetales bacterium]|nr:hypothetical protein [Spirochaetales bacterium]